MKSNISQSLSNSLTSDKLYVHNILGDSLTTSFGDLFSGLLLMGLWIWVDSAVIFPVISALSSLLILVGLGTSIAALAKRRIKGFIFSTLILTLIGLFGSSYVCQADTMVCSAFI